MTSKIRKVYVVGRRGPLQAAFTIKELREMLKIPDCQTIWSPNDFKGVEEIVPKLARPRKRITELMLTSLKQTPVEKKNSFIPKFFRSPLQFDGTERVSKVTLGINRLEGDDINKATAVLTNEKEQLECDLAIRSIGYKSIKTDSDLPFDDNKGVVVNQQGKVNNGLYTAGWLATGPTGVILTTMSNSFEIASRICAEIKNLPIASKPGYENLYKLLKEANVPVVTWEGWEKIDKYEEELGKASGKPREKVVSIKKMLEIGAKTL